MQHVWQDMGRLGGGVAMLLHCITQIDLLLWGISSCFPLASHFDLPGSQSIFGISQNPSMCMCTSLRQDAFYQKGVWIEPPLTLLPL